MSVASVRERTSWTEIPSVFCASRRASSASSARPKASAMQLWPISIALDSSCARSADRHALSKKSSASAAIACVRGLVESSMSGSPLGPSIFDKSEDRRTLLFFEWPAHRAVMRPLSSPARLSPHPPKTLRRGASYMERIYSPTRIQQPMRRVPGSERGAGEWEAIS